MVAYRCGILKEAEVVDVLPGFVDRILSLAALTGTASFVRAFESDESDESDEQSAQSELADGQKRVDGTAYVSCFT